MPKPCHVRHPMPEPGCVWCCLAEHDQHYRARCGIPGPATPGKCPKTWGGSPATRRHGYGDLVALLARRLGFRKKCGGCRKRRAWLNRWPTPADLWQRLWRGR